ncbi:diguanylate cyclase (GGDEF)-like protein/PAS domain S-box-containing protein [Pelomonas saccharophila]|uniref:Diguanylate cyclase (GGDEF)-like protein/PAS domain S-box-containing protein n=1 Tax=Roseateles saccharophilus TaxID=304 RepID=A0ABU1YMP0_ROSSA|nr:diguanylate cyclase [Roseateles saccharophilus]MDR7270128.1 diguanylate cyclase (GGDEF)-like protein/PAS domain S-box-containing protein [Roseateles saccharophilus]
MKIRSLFIAAGVAAVLVGVSAIAAMWMATAAEDAAEAQQQRAQQVARDVAGLVGVTYVFQRERDELSTSEWKRWLANIVRDLEGASSLGESAAELELLNDAAARLPVLFERALQTAAVPVSDFERRRRDQAFELLLGDTQAMADAAFRWSRNAGDARSLAEDVHERITMASIACFSLLLAVLAVVGVRRVLRPLARLTEVTEALERGEQVPLFGSTAQDELGTLKRRFDAMTIALRRRTDELREAEQRMRKITDNIPVVVSHFDRNVRADFGNLAVERVLRRPVSELMGLSFREIRGDAMWEIAKPHIDAVLQGQPQEFESFVTRDGETLYFVQRYVPDVDADGEVQGFYSVSFDITERRQAEALLAESEKRLRDIADNLPVMISYIDKDQRLLFLNETFTKWTGLDHRSTVGKTVAEAIPAPLYEQRREALARALAGERVEFDLESTSLGVNRFLHNLYLPDIAPDGSIRGLYALSTDVTEHRRLERQLAELARTDALTGLPNRYSFDEQLTAIIKRAQRAQTLTALLFLDIDRFKLINDSHGHGVGDEVLRDFARRLLALVRGTDFVGRLAGDEFVVVLEALGAPVEAEIVAGKIIDAINRPFATSAGELSVGTSIGIAIHPGDELDGEALLGRADQALYLAKDAGRNQYRLHAP